MKKIFSTRYNATATNTGLLILRVVFGILIMKHGYPKLVNFDSMREGFMSFMGLSSTISLALIIFAEFFCGLFLILGIFTRFACIPLMIGMWVAFFTAHGADVFGKGEMAFMYFAIVAALFFTGPGKYSIDGVAWK